MLNGLFGFMRHRKPALHRSLHRMRLANFGRDAVDAAMKRPKLIDELAHTLNALAHSDGQPAGFDVMATDAKKQAPVLDWLWPRRHLILQTILSRLPSFI